jgi:hypothetical protein
MRSFVAVAAIATSVLCVIVANAPKVATGTSRRRVTPVKQGNLPKERPAYRHAVVRTGVYSSREAESAIRNDAVVRVHYSGIQAPKLEPIRSPGLSMFVSYRRGERVYWTSKRVHVLEGEALLTDGTNMIRARCGNRLAESPQQPVEAQNSQPSEAELGETETVALPMAMASIPSPLDPPPDGYAGQHADTASAVAPEQHSAGTGAVARSWPPYRNGGLSLAIPNAMSLSVPPESWVAAEISYPHPPEPTPGATAGPVPGAAGPDSGANGAEPSPDISAPEQRPDPIPGGIGSTEFSRSGDLRYSGTVTLPTTGPRGSAWYERPPPTSGSGDNPGRGIETLRSHQTIPEPPVDTPEPSSMLVSAAALVALLGLRRHRFGR